MRGAAPLALLVGCALAAGAQPPAARVLESFDDAGAFRAAPSDGVTLALSGDQGRVGRALRMDFDFNGRAGYAVARRTFALPPLPAYWSLTLWVRGDTRPNTLELKLVDSTGLNVWWLRRPELKVDRDWTQLRFRSSDLSFAWGPAGGGPARGIAALEIAFTAGAGGKGWLALDELTLIEQGPLVADSVRPRVSASSSAPGHPAEAALPPDFAIPPRGIALHDVRSGWRSTTGGQQSIAFDFGGRRRLSGLVLDWSPADAPPEYEIETSDDAHTWTQRRVIRDSPGGRALLHLPETETRAFRINTFGNVGTAGYQLDAVYILGDSAAPTRSAFLERVADASAPGRWPRALTGQQSYWTVVGAPNDDYDTLVSEDGAVEPRPGSFSVEPFLLAGGRLLTWRDGATSHSLDAGRDPIPTVRRTTEALALATTVFAAPGQEGTVVWVRYRVVNRQPARREVTLFAAIRPVQVNPPWQFLGTAGGAASIRSLRWTGRALVVNDSDGVIALTPPRGSLLATFDDGGVVAKFGAKAKSSESSIRDATGFAEGAIVWRLSLRPRDSADVWIALPALTPPGAWAAVPLATTAREASAIGTERLTVARWPWKWDMEEGWPAIHLPRDGAALTATLHTALAHIRINARGPAIQPGTRSYRRSWIRDGALTSDALLRLGRVKDARAFLDWYLPNVFANGKVPCCVDARGADPVTENDADGELLHLAAQLLRFTHDTGAVVADWPTLRRVATHLDSLRLSRRAEPYTRPESLLVHGLLPPSISHEGYSARPAYSYWDDWWGVVGLDAAAAMARAVHDTAGATRFSAAGREMRSDVAASVRRSMELHHIQTLPGAAELGDLDPTSSTIALDPGGALDDLPRAAVLATFDSAWATLQRRMKPNSTWEVFTPYEWRDVGAFLRLGQPERAHEYAQWLMTMRRPTEWNQWSEAVWRDPRAPKFVGDMPHGWVASDFIRATLDMLAYQRDSTLVIGAGIPLAWVTSDTVRAYDIHTAAGPIEFDVVPIAGGARIGVSGFSPTGGLEIHAPFGRRPVRAVVNGHDVPLIDDGRAVRVPRTPATVDFFY